MVSNCITAYPTYFPGPRLRGLRLAWIGDGWDSFACGEPSLDMAGKNRVEPSFIQSAGKCCKSVSSLLGNFEPPDFQ